MERLLNDACDDFEQGRGVWEELARQSEDITNIPENEIKDTHTHTHTHDSPGKKTSKTGRRD